MGTSPVNDLAFKAFKKRKKDTQFSLKLTSMIDMFTILLVYMLTNYSAEGQIMSVATPDLRLPTSTAQKAPKTTSVIAITQEWILLDGKKIVNVEQALNSDNLLIPELLVELKKLRHVSERVGEMNVDMGFTGNVSIQGDRDLPYQIIKKIMLTCGQVGYNDMLLAVIKPD